jgi:hypothetical protein
MPFIFFFFLSLSSSVLKEALMSATTALVGGRKLFAFGNEIGEGLNTSALLNAARRAPTLTLETALPVVRSVAMTNFWLFDHVVFLSQFAKVCNADAHWHAVTASRVWLVAIFCSLYLDSKAYADASAAAAAGGEDAKAERTKAKFAAARQLRDVCDFVVAINNAEIVALSPMLVNVAGALSAAIFCYESWPRS